ncbi:hypothetical protein ES705_21287 [subsurface metagenome]
MSSLLNNLEDKLRVMEEEIQNLPGELDSAVARVDRDKLRRLSFSLDQDFNKLLDRLFAPQRINALLSLFILLPDGPNGPLYRRITEEDLAKWRAAWKSDIRVVAGKEGVAVIAISELARKYKTAVPQVILAAQQQGYIVLDWDGYQDLLDEIGSLIGGDEESVPEAIVGIPVTTTDSSQEVKILLKNSPLCEI